MNYRNFNNKQLAEVGLGTWQLGSADWGNVDEQEAMQILQT
ncbi:MAG: aldo/keto reductase, partial [Sphingobacteriaceae bacterium]